MFLAKYTPTNYFESMASHDTSTIHCQIQGIIRAVARNMKEGGLDCTRA